MIESFPARALETVGNVVPPVIAPGVVFAATASKQITNTVTETTLFGTGVGSLTLPAGILSPGGCVQIAMNGYSQGVSFPTVRIRAKVGGSTVCDTTAVNTGMVLSIVHGFEVNALLTCRTDGTTGTIIGQCGFRCADSPTFENSETTATTTIDTTAALALDVTFQWGAASASNIVTITNAIVQVLR